MDKNDKKPKMGTLKDFQKAMKEKGEDEMFACIANALKNAVKTKPDPQSTDY
jgi:hypothetical protein